MREFFNRLLLRQPRRLATCLLPLGLAVSAAAQSQDTILRSPSQLDVPDAFSQIDAGLADARLTPESAFYVKPNSYLQWGSVTARPHIVSRLSYGNSLRSRSGANENTLLEQVSPGVLLELGPKWKLDYTPTMSYYASKEFSDTLGHSASLKGGTMYGDWFFGLSQSYMESSQPLIETGQQTDQESFTTALSAAHHFNSKLRLELGLNQDFRSAQAFTSSRSWSTMDWLDYQIMPRVSLGLGVGGGYENLNIGSDMTYEQFQARVNMRVLNKVSLSIHGGSEVREILESNGDPLINPIYGASITYLPFQFTTFSLSGNRTVSSSLLQGQITEGTDISVALNQRLLGVLYLTLSAGFRNTRYILSTSTLALDRQDDTTTFAARLGYGFIKNGNVALFYNHNKNSSSSRSFGFTSDQVGLELSYRF